MRDPYSRTLFELLDEQAGRYPDVNAAIQDGQRVTYTELARRSCAVAAALKARGVRRGDRVAILMGNSIEWLESCFGISALGATVVPLSTWSKSQELDFLLSDSEAVFLLAVERFGEQDFSEILRHLIPELEQTETGDALSCARYPYLQGIAMFGRSELPAGIIDYRSFVTVDPLKALPAPGTGASAIDDGIILYTSGSTSYPKAVRMRQYGIIENGFNIGERQGLRAGDRVLVSPPLFWAYGAVNALPATLTHGATLVLQTKFDPAETLNLIEQNQCTAIYTLPVMTSSLVSHPEFSSERTRTLRTGLTIGSPQDIIKAAKVLGATDICNIYGSSETYGNCCVTSHHWPLEERAHSQGEPLPGVTLRIVDVATEALVKPGEEGWLEVSGYLMAGYSGASARQNGKVFTDDGFYRTGDIGRITEDGRFVFVGRGDEMIKRAGINVSPVEIEEVLVQHPGVAQAAVVGVPDQEKGEVIIAYVVPHEGQAVSVEELETHCQERLSRYKVPDQIVELESLPVTNTGKLKRRELKEIAASSQS